MRAAAVLGPAAKESDLQPFRLPGVELELFSDERHRNIPDALLIFGGDGTLHHRLRFLVESKAALLIVPGGSGNDFARGLGIRTSDDALALWRRFVSGAAQIREVDLGVIKASGSAKVAEHSPADSQSPRYFCNVAGVGLDAAANRLANRFPRWLRARGGYLVAALAAMIWERHERTKLLTCFGNGEWRAWRDETATLVAVANGPAYGGGIRIAPNARADDGQLDVCLVRAVGLWRMLQLLRHVLRTEHLQLPEVSSWRGERVRIETATPKEIYADGEYAGLTPAEFSVLPRALRVIAP